MHEWWRSVTVAVVAGFGACLVAVAGLVAVATEDAFDREEARAHQDLVAAGESQAQLLGTLFGSAEPLVADLAADPRLASFERPACEAALASFASVASSARLVVLDPGGRQVCAIPSGAPTSRDGSERFVDALQGRSTRVEEAYVDPVSGEPSAAVAAPIGGGSETGAVVAVLFLGKPPLEVPLAVDPSTVVVALDRTRELVIATTPQSPYALGERVEWSSPPAVGPDGVERIWRETSSPETGWVFLAGLERDKALAGASEQRTSLLRIGAAILGFVLLLGAILQRRVGRPIRRLGSAIGASRAGAGVHAPMDGPTEIVTVAGVFNDLVDAHRALTDRLSHDALHDPLTGLLNRRGATQELERLLDSPHAEDLIVLFIDLDRFKLVNDSHGHAVGDELLRAVARRFEAAVPPHWVVTRFGGDEFLVLCPATDDPTPAVELLGDVMRSTFHVQGQDLTVGGSTGIATARRGQRATDLIREADTAMYRAKERGRGGYATFDEEMRAWTVQRLDTERDLRGVLDRDELAVHFQPIVRLADGAVVGAEALVRWQHPRMGILGPAAFLSVAEEIGLVLALGEWVAEQAAQQATTWRALGTPAQVSINVAAAQLLQGDFAAVLGGVLRRTGAHPGDLVVEVTESTVLADMELTVGQLERLRAMGVRVSLDDFGTGYSSLTYLQRLPTDELKIDRSFVASMGADRMSAAIVDSVIDLAHAVGLEVVAEGIETTEQLETLRRLGCDRAQGYLLGRPGPAEACVLGLPAPAAAGVDGSSVT